MTELSTRLASFFSSRSGIFLILLVGVFGSARTATASCGSHVQSERERLARAQEPPIHEVPRPCHGPNCGQRRDAPLPPTITPPSPNDRDSFLTGFAFHNDTPSRFIASPRDLLPASRPLSPLERPPRA